jgi:hypothetical protein
MGTFFSGVEHVLLDEMVLVGRVADQGFSSCWLPHGSGIDAAVGVLDHAPPPGPGGRPDPPGAPGRPARSGAHAGG